MKPIADPRLKTDEIDGPVERGYDAWNRAKIERGVAQARDRDAMIPVEQLLADLRLERYFTPQARDDLEAIRDWIAGDNWRAADRVVARIARTAMMFGQFLMLGRAGQVADTREFSVVGLPYLIVYRRVSETEVDVLTVLHTRRRNPLE